MKRSLTTVLILISGHFAHAQTVSEINKFKLDPVCDKKDRCESARNLVAFYKAQLEKNVAGTGQRQDLIGKLELMSPIGKDQRAKNYDYVLSEVFKMISPFTAQTPDGDRNAAVMSIKQWMLSGSSPCRKNVNCEANQYMQQIIRDLSCTQITDVEKNFKVEPSRINQLDEKKGDPVNNNYYGVRARIQKQKDRACTASEGTPKSTEPSETKTSS